MTTAGLNQGSVSLVNFGGSRSKVLYKNYLPETLWKQILFARDKDMISVLLNLEAAWKKECGICLAIFDWVEDV